ncbi:unnamed protein product [Strongylus vulgaris]|uniref:Uncharacterized protein n=1 Tax=Strongylus vulgaris TaxID=40348 RepID=A0A3P7IPP7_STRVU|nr:unnamed protein product [Strongylus vulgaris]
MEATTLLLAIGVAFLLFLIIRWFLERFEIDKLETRAVFITGCDSVIFDFNPIVEASLLHKTVFVGFGKELVVRCAERGMPVFAGCLFEKSINDYQQLSKSYRIPVDAFIIDVTKDDSVNNAKAYLESRTKQYGGF